MKPFDLEQYRILVERSPTMVWRAGRDAKCDYFNETWLAFTGRTLEQEIGDGWAEGVHPDDLERCLAIYRDKFEGRQVFEMEYRLRRHDGAYRYVFDRGVPYADPNGAFSGFIGSCVDVDDRRHQEAAACAVELFELSLDHLCVAGFDGYFRRVSPSWTKALGWTQEELMSRPSIELVHPEDRPATLAARSRLTEGEPLHALVNRYRCKDGTYRWFEWRSVSRADQGLVYAVARDVTDQREAQRALRELTESLSTTLNSIADGVIAIDAANVVVRMNPVAEKLTGWTSADAKGKMLGEVFRVIDADTHSKASPPLERTLEEGLAAEDRMARRHYTRTLLVARDGTERPIASSRAPMRSTDRSVSGAVIVFRDMTAEIEAREEHERLQQQLVLADRIASVGTLAAGIAHEINNPLAYVMANLDLLIEEIPKLSAPEEPAVGAEWTEMALEARDGTERIRRIVAGLKTFSRADKERRAIIDVMPVLELSVDIVSNEIKHRARLVKDYGPLPLVDADDARLGQVFINLLVNAVQAFPEGTIEANEIRVTTSTDASGRAVIAFHDTGPGLAARGLDRGFDPFFTSGPRGVGTGLALSICHNIVAGLGGEITASTEKGRGTILRVVLPAANDQRRAEADSAPAVGQAATARRAAVLIVDDERTVGFAMGRLLPMHDVTVVTTAKAALDLLTPNSAFDVVLSDLMMPEMSGMDLFEELVRRASPMAERMVFVTGGAFTPGARAFLDRVPNARLEKPFSAAAVREAVQRLAR